MTALTPASRTGELTIASHYTIENAEARPVQDSRSGGTYRPTRLTFTLTAYRRDARTQSDPCELHYLRYRDLDSTSVTLRGLRVKKDGTTGVQPHIEYLTRESAPDWARAVIDAELAELRAA
jgi:hypothetical protein